MYAVKEICRNMANPTEGAWKKLKRLGRYLQGNARGLLSTLGRARNKKSWDTVTRTGLAAAQPVSQPAVAR